MAIAGRRFVEGNVHTLHFVCAGRSAAGVHDDCIQATRLATAHGGVIISNTIPKAARANPFEPLNGILGADGERWAALNAKGTPLRFSGDSLRPLKRRLIRIERAWRSMA